MIITAMHAATDTWELHARDQGIRPSMSRPRHQPRTIEVWSKHRTHIFAAPALSSSEVISPSCRRSIERKPSRADPRCCIW